MMFFPQHYMSSPHLYGRLMKRERHDHLKECRQVWRKPAAVETIGRYPQISAVRAPHQTCIKRRRNNSPAAFSNLFITSMNFPRVVLFIRQRTCFPTSRLTLARFVSSQPRASTSISDSLVAGENRGILRVFSFRWGPRHLDTGNLDCRKK